MSPQPGSMMVCQAECPHYRGGCAKASSGRIPPLTQLRGGQEYCGEYNEWSAPPRNERQRGMFTAMESGA